MYDVCVRLGCLAWLPGHGAYWHGCCGCRRALPALPCRRALRAAGLSGWLLLLLRRLLLFRLLAILCLLFLLLGRLLLVRLLLFRRLLLRLLLLPLLWRCLLVRFDSLGKVLEPPPQVR